jgi:hypothetical protein
MRTSIPPQAAAGRSQARASVRGVKLSYESITHYTFDNATCWL